MKKYFFSDIAYIFEHGKKPHGCGCWAFSVEGVENSLFWTNEDKAKNLSEMKKEAERIADARGIPHGATLIIEP